VVSPLDIEYLLLLAVPIEPSAAGLVPAGTAYPTLFIELVKFPYRHPVDLSVTEDMLNEPGIESSPKSYDKNAFALPFTTKFVASEPAVECVRVSALSVPKLGISTP
tara:strand:- start:962 stop:1282 length:321 start_codon:yes stop_codon:yes gene_type:complete